MRSKFRILASVAAAACLCGAPVGAARGEGGQDGQAGLDKSQYTLFNPTPAALMRELSTDRPDTTESAYTVDAGHLQIETSFVDYTRDNDGGGDFDSLSILPTNVKLGLTNNMDVQFVFEPWISENFDPDDGSPDEDVSGFGVTQLRLKVNLWGNDGGDTALALMPFVQFPTSDDDFGATDKIEGGLIVPFAMSLPREWGLGLMAEFDAVRDGADEDYELQFVHTATVGHDIVGDLAGYIEYIGITTTEEGNGYVSLLGGGLTYGVNENVQLDCGVNFGLSKEADDFNVFAGVSVRR
ncbi:MAG: transporter [Tepidisphaeraceae bacterium]